ncbi:hypothetical protein [Gordonia aurantiaca]|uniref:hypothetical protein n=1 Tax=Gordonia sp. B21 TaxID=3151852 RepID=UPI0032662852
MNRDDVDAVVQSWRAAALAIHATDVEPLARASGPASRVAGALTATAEPARHALDSIGTRLTAMGTALTAFEATAEDSDDRAASELDALRER